LSFSSCKICLIDKCADFDSIELLVFRTGFSEDFSEISFFTSGVGAIFSSVGVIFSLGGFFIFLKDFSGKGIISMGSVKVFFFHALVSANRAP